MKVIVRAKTGWLRRPISFTLSAWVHGGILAWVALGHAGSLRERPRTLYEQEIRPNEKRIIWYNLRDRLPDVAPTPAPARVAVRPPRALRKFEQSIAAGARDDARPPQLIWQPAPEIQAPKSTPLPNVVAVAPVRPVRPFLPPPQVKAAPSPAPALPDAPRTAAIAESPKLPLDLPNARPKPLPFTPPPVKPSPGPAPALPDAPRAVATTESPKLPLNLPNARPRPLAFTPPPEVRRAPAAPESLPAAPEVDRSLPSATLPKAPRPFVQPPNRPAAPAAASVVSVDAPAIPSSPHRSPEVSLAIVGLNPAKTAEVPAPPAPHQAGFSGGPKLVAQAESAEPPDPENSRPDPAILVVPGLLVHDGSQEKPAVLVPGSGPTSRENLAAAARLPHGPGAPPPAPLPVVRGAAPDPSLQGRLVYMIAIQMPNITSYSGSWTVWFAERQIVPGARPADLRAPLPLHKVDPKYVASAALERVEGTVRLSAVIRRDGRVGAVSLLRHLDERLDRSAQEALAKWEFEPALRNGAPVEVDAVFEIPFRLAPRSVR